MQKKIILKSGLRVLLVPKPEFETMTIMILVRTGSADEQEGELGVSHFLEHMLVQSSKKRPTPMLNAEFIDSIGGVHNAFTGKIYSGYYAKVAKEFWREAIDYLADGVINPLFKPEEMENERTSIIEEIKMHNDIPSDALSELYSTAVYGNTALGRSISGTRESVTALSRDDIIRYYKSRYTSQNSMVVVVGNWDTDEKTLISCIEELMFYETDASETDFDMDYKIKPVNCNFEVRDIEQSNLLIGFATPGLEHPDWHAASLLVKIIGGGMSSRMFQEIRVKRGLSYDVRSGMSSYVGNGSMGTVAGVASNKWQEAATAIIEQYSILNQNGVTETELARAKKMIRGATKVEMEDTEELAWEHGMSELLLNREFAVEQEFEKIDRVKREDIGRILKRYFSPDKIIFSGIGPDFDQDKIDRVLKRNQ